MYKMRLGEPIDGSKSQFGYIEMDPSGRYGRFRDVLGRGAVKTVYKAFDEVLGMEVAWNQVKLNDVFRSSEDLQRLYSEVHVLKDLDHKSIMQFYTSWIDVERGTFNFISEMFTSGTLREYRQRYKRIDIQAVKNWARQILQGLVYLHGHDPPVIHRDLKCDNIFINGHLGQVKIGDLGLATLLRGSQHAHSVIGTPEFMAPELYEEDYDELVDVYSFGMCVLEMLTSEYPYSECSNPAQIYKKVTSGKLPDAFYRIRDVEAQNFVRKCLEAAPKRPWATELLMDPFLAYNESESSPVTGIPNQILNLDAEALKVPHLSCKTKSRTDMTIIGKINPEDDDTIFLTVKISDKKGKTRNIHFSFDMVNDTAHDVAMEMVKELEITDYEPFEISKMIAEEVSSLVPNWKEWESPPYQYQHSFGYDDEDNDDNTPHPFCSLSSRSSSHASLPWPRRGEDLTINDIDDTSSQSSFGTCKYSNYNYCFGNENEIDTSRRKGAGQPHFLAMAHKCTRFFPEQSVPKDCNEFKHARGMQRIRSMVDVRSQLLHRMLLAEIHKRRVFNTIGAVENIGYYEPDGYYRGSSSQMRGEQRFEW